MGNIQTSGPNQAVYISGQIRPVLLLLDTGLEGGRESVGLRLRIIINFADSKFYKRADINYHWEYQTGHGGFPWVLFGHILYLASYISS